LWGDFSLKGKRGHAQAAELEEPTKYSAIPAAPIHAAPHFVAFFVPRVVVYASSQDFVETALGQPYLDTKGAFIKVCSRKSNTKPI
jgi:hypothetical protein